MYLELTKKQLKEAVDNYIEDCTSTEEMHKFTMKIFKQYINFEGCDLTPFKKLIDKHLKDGNVVKDDYDLW